MVKGIQQPSGIGDEGSLIAAAQAAGHAGFEAFEPILTESGLLSIGAEEADVRGAGEAIRATGLTIPSVYCPLFGRTPLSSEDAAVQQRARELLIAGLDRAAWLGASLFAVPAGRITDPDNCRLQSTGYADALNALYLMLEWVVPEAEVRGVVVGMETPNDPFLISPVETRDLVDALATPWLQVCIDTAAVQRYGFPADWIETLGPRIGSIRTRDCRGDQSCPLGEGDVDWPAVAAAIEHVNYTGPVICARTGDPSESLRRLAAVGL